jgi:hypothetical protein
VQAGAFTMAGMTTGFRWAVAIAAAIVVSAVPAPSAGDTGACQRAVSIAPQASAGEGTGRLTFSVLSSGCAAAGDVGYAVTSGTALSGVDFRLLNGRLRWSAGDQGIRTITATVVADAEREADLEDFTVRLVDPSPGVRIVRQAGQARILDDDGPGPHSTVDDSACGPLMPNQWCPCKEQDMPGKPYCVPVDFHLSALPPDPVTVHWATLDGTARAGVDYVGVSGETRTVRPGETATVLPVELLSRPQYIPARWFYVRIVAVSAGRITDSTAVVTIEGS